MRKRLVGLIIICVLLVGCSYESSDLDSEIVDSYDNLMTLRVSVQPYFLSAQLQYIIENELDKEAGIEIELVFSESGNEQIEAEAMELWDIATIGGAFVYALADDSAVLVSEFIISSDSNNIYALSSSEIFDAVGFNPTYPDVYGSPDSISNQTLLITENTTSEYVASKWLAAIGVREENVEIITGPFEDSYVNLVEGTGEIASLTAPYSFKAEDEGYKVVASATDLNIPFYEVIIANKDTYEDMQEEIAIFIELMLEVNSILEEDTELKVENARTWYETYGEYEDESYLDYVEEECALKEYVTTENYSFEDYGEFAEDYATFLAQSGNIEAEDLLNVKANIDGEIFETALESVSQNK